MLCAQHVLASLSWLSGAEQAVGVPSWGWGALLWPWHREGSPSDTSGHGLGCAWHRFGCAWAPMCPFGVGSHGDPPSPWPGYPPCQPDSPPLECQAGGLLGCVRGSLALLGCQGAGHSPPPSLCPGWEGTLGTSMGHCQPPMGSGRSADS